MTEPKYRIPRMAAVVMVLGSASCDDDKGGGTAGVNVSDRRLERISKRLCELGFECIESRSDYEEEFGTERECVEEVLAEAKADFEGLSNKCGDAYLDYYECYLSLGCSIEEGECEEFYEVMERECPELDGEERDSMPKRAPALHSLRKRR